MRENENGIVMLKTVRENFEGYTKKQVGKAILARKVQAMVEHPPDKKFKQMVSHGNLSNCNVTVEDVTTACALFGHNISRLKGGYS